MSRFNFLAFGFILSITLTGCQKDNTSAPTNSPAAAKQPEGQSKDHAGGHGDEGPFIQLGVAQTGGWTLTTSRDEGLLSAGGEAAIDCSITGGTGKISAVRFWIGREDAKGAIKALASIEDPDEPTRWHTHVEIPNPFGIDSKLWIEVEDNSGAKHVAGFDLTKK